MPRLILFGVLLLALSCPSPNGGAAAKADATPSPRREEARVVIETPSGEVAFRVELAVTPNERMRGLMFRDHLDEDAGMLFIFERMQRLRFWMKNTRIPLDMLFIDEAGEIVGIVENAEPLSLESRGVSLPSRYVLEVNGGTCRRLGIRPGQRVRFDGIPGHPAKTASGPVR